MLFMRILQSFFWGQCWGYRNKHELICSFEMLWVSFYSIMQIINAGNKAASNDYFHYWVICCWLFDLLMDSSYVLQNVRTEKNVHWVEVMSSKGLFCPSNSPKPKDIPFITTYLQVRINTEQFVVVLFAHSVISNMEIQSPTMCSVRCLSILRGTSPALTHAPIKSQPQEARSSLETQLAKTSWFVIGASALVKQPRGRQWRGKDKR